MADLLHKLIDIIENDTKPSYFLNKDFDLYKWAGSLLKDLEDKRSAITAITREQANELSQNNLQYSSVKHESRLNCLYRLIGLPTEKDLDFKCNLIDSNGNIIKNMDDLTKKLLEREYEELKITFKQYLTTNSVQELNTKLNSLEEMDQQLLAQLFDPQNINPNRLSPPVQFSNIRYVVETKNIIAPVFASTEERYIDQQLTSPPFLETCITTRLLQQSGGSQINTQGAVEDIIIQYLGYALSEIAKQYQKNQAEAEKQLINGIALIRPKPTDVNSALIKQSDINAGTRENDGIKTEIDVRTQYSKNQAQILQDILSLLPLENDVIPTSIQFDGTPFQERNIKNNALTQSFFDILNSNIDAINRTLDNNDQIMKKRQAVQDKLNANLNSSIGLIGGISLAEMVIVIAALFILDEKDLVGLISQSRFDSLIGSSSSTTTSINTQNTAQKQINIFDILKQFQGIKSSTTVAVQNLQNTIKSIYEAFRKQLSRSHIIS